MNISLRPSLLEGSFGGGNIAGHLLRFLLAIVFLCIQGAIIYSPEHFDLHRISSWMPVVIAILLMLISLSLRNATGKFSVYPAELKISNGKGKEKSVNLEQAATVKMDKNHFSLRDAQGKILLAIFNPNPIRSGGLIWLLVNYREQIPKEVVEKIEGLKEPENIALRSFFAIGEHELFSDPGFIVYFKNMRWFFPLEELNKRHVGLA